MTRIDADWLRAPSTRAVVDALAAAGHEVYFVGGCVRDALIDRPVADIDISTDAHPEAVQRAVKDAGLKAIPTGAEHGTITVVADDHAFEVTTFRRDVATDGRHAVVTFSDSLYEDASRRDFTMNALYAAPDGTVIDPVGGLADLRAGQVRFIGTPRDRIAEDYLRILRFFRFHAWYAPPESGVDADALAACTEAAGGLAMVSAERVGHEMRRLTAAADPSEACAAMERSGILARLLPGASAKSLPVLVALEPALDAAPDPIRRLAVLGGAEAAARLRLTRSESRSLALLQGGVASMDPPAALAYRHGLVPARDIVLLRAALFGHALEAGVADDLATGAAATFPLRAADLMPRLQGAALGAGLRAREEAWIASGFRLGRDALLALE